MEHTITANGTRHGHTGGLVLSQLHIGLAVGFAIVASLTAFGGGVIVGMWYKASEQTTPLSVAATATPGDKPAQSPEAASPPPEPPAPVTFYNTLTNNQVAYAPLTPPTLPPAVSSAPVPSKGLVATPPPTAPVGATSVKTVAPGATPSRSASASNGTTESPKAAPTVKAIPPATLAAVGASKSPHTTVRTAATGEPPKHAKTAPAPKGIATSPAPATSKVTALAAAASAPPAAAPSSVSKPAPPERPAAKAAGAQKPASPAAVITAKAASTEDFSVQVGSFGNSDQAERLRTSLAQKGYPVRVQPSTVPGQGLRYRVRVGSYAERTAADQTAHHLTAQEQVPAIVAGKD